MDTAYRRLLKRVPVELSALLEVIHAGPKLLSYNPGGPGWSADIQVHKRKFRLTSEYGYIAVEEVVDGSFRAVPPPPDQRKSISVQQVAELINARVA